jgi:hypothetical protein
MECREGYSWLARDLRKEPATHSLSALPNEWSRMAAKDSQTAAAASAQGTKCAEQQNKTYVSDSDRTALEIYRYVESAGCGQWRATTLGDLGNVVGSYDAKLTDLLKGLWSQKYIELR